MHTREFNFEIADTIIPNKKVVKTQIGVDNTAKRLELDTDFRKHDVTSPLGRFLGTTSEWNSISSSGDAGYSFLPNTNYVGVFSITRTGTNSPSLSSSLSIAGGALVDSHTATDNSDIANNFGMLGFWANANAFGSSNTAGDPDNGLEGTVPQ